jgi:hypothetical protein
MKDASRKAQWRRRGDTSANSWWNINEHCLKKVDETDLQFDSEKKKVIMCFVFSK